MSKIDKINGETNIGSWPGLVWQYLSGILKDVSELERLFLFSSFATALYVKFLPDAGKALDCLVLYRKSQCKPDELSNTNTLGVFSP